MEILLFDSPDDVARVGADIVERAVRRPAGAVLGLATGTSPLGIYRELIRRHRDDGLSFASTRAFLLDEYVGLARDHPASYARFIESEFVGQVDFAPGAADGPNGTAADLVAECERYEAAIAAAGGIDVQLLGIGADGHIGFNEPGSSLGSRTRIKTLTAKTRADNARFFSSSPDDVPRHVLTQGVGTISRAGHLVLVALGKAKAAPIALAVEGPVTAMVPASALQLHPHVTVLLDTAAASRLRLIDYYRETQAGKPPWQVP